MVPIRELYHGKNCANHSFPLSDGAAGINATEMFPGTAAVGKKIKHENRIMIFILIFQERIHGYF